MAQKLLIIAFSCIFIVQIHHVSCQDSKIIIPAPAETEPQKEFANAIATRTIDTLLRHLRISMTNPVSAPVIRYVTTSVRFILTNVTGQKTVLNLVDFIVDLLMDSNTLANLQVFHKRLLQLAASGRKSAIVLNRAAEAARKLLDEPQVLLATEGLIDGVNLLMEDMTEQKLREGIVRVMKLQKMVSFLKPTKILDKMPATLQKLRRVNSDLPVNYQNVEDKEMQLQTRSVGHYGEYEWINKKGDIKKSKGKGRNNANEGSDLEENL